MTDALPWLAFALLAGVLVGAAVMDARTGRVPNALTIGGTLAGLALWAAGGWLWRTDVDGMDAVWGMLAALVPFALIYFLGGLGGGDVKLMAAVGALTANWQCVVATALYAFVAAAIMAVVVMISKRLVLRTVLRVLHAAFAWRAGQKVDLDTDSPRIPFAVAACAGGLLGGAEYLLGLQLPWTNF